MAVADVLSYMIEQIVQDFHPEQVVLFGARAWGDTRPDSDYQLLVVMPDGTDVASTTLAIRKALTGSPAPSQVLVTTPERLAAHPSSFSHAALREGIPLYPPPATPHSFAPSHPPTTNDQLPEITKRLTATLRPLRIILFGSRALGCARPDSDYDLLIVIPDGGDEVESARAARRALADLPISKDVLVVTASHFAHGCEDLGSVVRVAAREGVTLYERD